MIPDLRPFQLDMVDRIRQECVAGKRIIVAQATTGAGKTTVGCHVIKKCVEKGKRSLVIAHRRKLVDQFSERLEEFQVNHGIIMAGQKGYGEASVQVASRDTLSSRVFRHEWTGLPPADLIIVDEFHRAAAEDSDYRRILAQYPKSIILGLTATPVGPDGNGMGPWAQGIVCAAPTTQLIRDGFLVPVKCFAPDRKLHRGKVKLGIAGDLVESWKEFAENQPSVLFCSRISHSTDAVASFNEAGIRAAHVDAETTDEDRERIFEKLGTGEIKVVSNVGIIKEGVDIPCLGCCQIYMDMSGRVAFLQALGRIMRPYPGKLYGILIDHAGAVFRHGFPDEDTEWTLEGNADADFKQKKDKGLAKDVNYCKGCEMLFSGMSCPQCGKMPSKPPKSIFAAPPVDCSNEILTEAERGGQRQVDSRDERIKHWLRCVAASFYKGGSFKQASVIFKRKYNEWPDDNFPCLPPWSERGRPVREVYPEFGKKKAVQA